MAVYYSEGPILVIQLDRYADDECAMCGAVGLFSHAVPWYCGPVMEGCSEGGYKTVCKACYDRWDAWDTQMRVTVPL